MKSKPVTSRPRGRPRREEADAARRLILDAALQEFITHGFAGASMVGIARAAGVAKLTLYRHFETKELLFAAVAQKAQYSVRERLGPIIRRDRPPEQVLRQIISKLYDGYTNPNYLAVLRMVIAESHRFPSLGRSMLDNATHVAGPLAEYLEQFKNSGLMQIDSPLDAANQICGLASGAGRYVLISPPTAPSRRRHAIESLVQLFTQAWRIDPATAKPDRATRPARGQSARARARA